MSKPWYTSKTIFVNLLATLAIVVQSYTGFVLDAQTQVAILGGVNVILRLVTKRAIEW